MLNIFKHLPVQPPQVAPPAPPANEKECPIQITDQQAHNVLFHFKGGQV